MALSVFELFKVGIGPSSSHTVGPMRAAGMFVRSLAEAGFADRSASVKVELFGSLGATGHGHGSVPAVVLGLLGQEPETVDPRSCQPVLEEVHRTHQLALGGGAAISFDPDDDIVLRSRPTTATRCAGWTGSPSTPSR